MRLDMVAVVSPAVSPCAEPSRKLLHLRYKPPRHIEAHYMQRTHLLPLVLIATVRPGHFAEASVMCFDMVPQNPWYAFCGPPQWDRLPPADLTVCVLATEVIPDSARSSFYFTLTGPRCLAYKTKTLE